MKKPAPRRGIDPGHTVVALAGLRVAAELVLRLIELDKATDKQIKPAVIIVVEPNSTRCPPGRSYTSFLSHVGECATNARPR